MPAYLMTRRCPSAPGLEQAGIVVPRVVVPRVVVPQWFRFQLLVTDVSSTTKLVWSEESSASRNLIVIVLPL